MEGAEISLCLKPQKCVKGISFVQSDALQLKWFVIFFGE